jgi:putative IMPACT (imprinted ancient) family translation regulator
MAIEASEIIEKTIDISYTIEFDYQNINKVMRVIKEKNLELISQNLAETCKIEIAVRKKNASIVFAAFNEIFGVSIQIKD